MSHAMRELEHSKKKNQSLEREDEISSQKLQDKRLKRGEERQRTLPIGALGYR